MPQLVDEADRLVVVFDSTFYRRYDDRLTEPKYSNL